MNTDFLLWGFSGLIFALTALCVFGYYIERGGIARLRHLLLVLVVIACSVTCFIVARFRYDVDVRTRAIEETHSRIP
jgi:flagellar motor component MotA